MPTIIEIHTRLFTTCWLFALGMSLWAFTLYFRRRPLGSDFLGALVICEILMILQTIFTLVLYVTGYAQPERWVYYLYNLMMALTIPALYAYTKGQTGYREAMLYALTMLFLWGLVLRAVITG